MSVWTDIQKRSNGKYISKEDFNTVYTGGKEAELESGTYKDVQYHISTCGTYPNIGIFINKPISAFAGADVVKLKLDDGKYYDLDRMISGSMAVYIYRFNKEDDYVLNEHDGQQYSVEMLKDIAQRFIEKLLESENNLDKYM